MSAFAVWIGKSMFTLISLLAIVWAFSPASAQTLRCPSPGEVKARTEAVHARLLQQRATRAANASARDPLQRDGI
jgi:hypothetical protein